ncbi:MAG: hypothetical protein Q8Q01_03955 [archaeon]|nr:hypothetical protein [archaeon]
MKDVWNDYTGRKEEPVEDRSIIQPDGSRACYNWECSEGFQNETFEDPSTIGLDDNDEAARFLREIKRKS